MFEAISDNYNVMKLKLSLIMIGEVTSLSNHDYYG